MRKDAPALKVFQRIKNQAKTNLNELCDFWNIYEKQLFFVSAIAIYDRYFIEQLSVFVNKKVLQKGVKKVSTFNTQ